MRNFVTPRETIAIREAFMRGEMSNADLARHYARNYSTIRNILVGLSYRFAPGPICVPVDVSSRRRA